MQGGGCDSIGDAGGGACNELQLTPQAWRKLLMQFTEELLMTTMQIIQTAQAKHRKQMPLACQQPCST